MRRSGTKTAYDTIRARIISGELRPGERVIEAELSEQIGVSRTPIREALRQLSAEALIQQLPNGFTMVTEIDAESVTQIGLLRSRIEGILARDAATRLTEAQLAEMQRLVSLSYRLSDDEAEVLRLGKLFHGIVRDASTNIWAHTMLRQINGHVDRVRSLSTGIAGRGVDASDEHGRILAALEARNPNLAEQEMCRHIEAGVNSASLMLNRI